VADLPIDLPDPELAGRLAGALDVEGKILRALEALGPIAGRDVVLVNGDGGLRARQLVSLGARLTVLERPDRLDLIDGLGVALADLPGVTVAAGEPGSTGLAAASADAVVSYWSAYRGPDPVEIAEAERILRPGGRLLILHDYGRDDVSRLFSPERPEYTTWSHRRGPFLVGGFKIRVIHCFWTFDSIEEASALLRDGFGEPGAALAATLGRPRLSYNVAIYHRTRSEPDAEPDAASAAAPGAKPGAEPDAEPDAAPGAEPDAEPDAEPGAEPDAEPAAR